MSRVDADTLTEDARAALLELARLLGRMAAEDAVDPSTPDTSPTQSNLLQSALSLHVPCGQSQRASWLRGVFPLLVFHEGCAKLQFYPDQLVFLVQSICRRAECICQCASLLAADIYLQI
jgi:hypothetical protein